MILDEFWLMGKHIGLRKTAIVRFSKGIIPNLIIESTLLVIDHCHL